jgi:hypothetical protein
LKYESSTSHPDRAIPFRRGRFEPEAPLASASRQTHLLVVDKAQPLALSKWLLIEVILNLDADRCNETLKSDGGPK